MRFLVYLNHKISKNLYGILFLTQLFITIYTNWFNLCLIFFHLSLLTRSLLHIPTVCVFFLPFPQNSIRSPRLASTSVSKVSDSSTCLVTQPPVPAWGGEFTVNKIMSKFLQFSKLQHMTWFRRLAFIDVYQPKMIATGMTYKFHQ